MSLPEQPPLTLSIIGPEGSGKTTLTRGLALRIGGTALNVPEWPSLQSFLDDPAAHAYENQRDAMDYTVTAHATAASDGAKYIIADSCPDRIHLVHSAYLHRAGFIDAVQWESLEVQYQNAALSWGNAYMYLQVGLATLRQRLLQRGRPEDAGHNMDMTESTTARWQELLSDQTWKRGKNILEINAELSIEALQIEAMERLGIVS